MYSGVLASLSALLGEYFLGTSSWRGCRHGARSQPVSTTPSCPVVLGLSQASLESGAVRLAPLNQQGGRARGCEEEESAGAWASHVII